MKRKKCAAVLLIILAFIILLFGCSRDTRDQNQPIKEDIMPEQTETVPMPIVFENRIKKDVYLGNIYVGDLSETEVMGVIRELAAKTNISVQDASLDANKWIIKKKEQVGKVINEQKTMEVLLQAQEGDKVEPVIDTVKPNVTVKQLKKKIVLLSSYSTRLLDKRSGRMNNIQLAAEKIDYTKIAPGEEFSFNGILGRRTREKGYEEAPIIIKTEEGPEKKMGVGGGICQLSSTIFNAADEAGMRITERHVHSKNVGYVPKGRDATVAYGSSDLKFVNSHRYPIMIRVYLSSKSLTVNIIENRI